MMRRHEAGKETILMRPRELRSLLAEPDAVEMVACQTCGFCWGAAATFLSD